jgi:four helix bundle protein
MGKAKRFEDLQIWKDSRELCQFVANIAPLLTKKHLYRLKDQIEGSSGSIMDNIAEGYERTGKKEFINFLIIAKGSAGEFRSQLYRLLDNDILTQNEFSEKYKYTIGISKQITGFIKYLKSSDVDGWRWLESSADYFLNDED